MKWLFTLLLLPVLAIGQIPAFKPNTYVNDYTNTLTSKQLYEINDSILALERRSSVQIAMVLVDGLPNGMAIEDYTLGIGREWKVGNAHNGLVYAAALSEHKQRLEVADRLQGDITDYEAHEMTDELKPYLRKKDYYGALMELFDQIKSKVDPVQKEQLALAKAEREKKDAVSKHKAGVVLLWILGICMICFTIGFPIYKRNEKKRKLKEAEEEAKRQKDYDSWLKERQETLAFLAERDKYKPSKPNHKTAIPNPPTFIPIPIPMVPDPPKSDSPSIWSSNSDDDDNSSSSSSSSSDDSSSFGSWGGDSGGSGFSGGGSSNDW